MKIQDNLTTAATPVAPVRPGTAGDRTTPAKTEAAAQAAAATAVAFDAAKVARLKTAIAAGTYRVDASKIADELIESARELIHARKKA